MPPKQHRIWAARVKIKIQPANSKNYRKNGLKSGPPLAKSTKNLMTTSKNYWTPFLKTAANISLILKPSSLIIRKKKKAFVFAWKISWASLTIREPRNVTRLYLLQKN